MPSYLVLRPDFPVRVQSLLAHKEVSPLLITFETQGLDLLRRVLPAPWGIHVVLPGVEHAVGSFLRTPASLALPPSDLLV